MHSLKNRFFAELNAVFIHSRTPHFAGLPNELSSKSPTKMPSPRVLVIDEDSEGGVFLYRLTSNGGDAGDTWHPDVQEAKHQAEYEYGNAIGHWIAVPGSVNDAREFAVRSINGSVADPPP